MKRLVVFCMALGLTLGLLPSVAAQDGGNPIAPPIDTPLPLGDIIFDADFSDSSLWGGDDSTALSYTADADGLALRHTDPTAGLEFMPLAAGLDANNFYTEFSFTWDACDSGTSAILFGVRVSDDAPPSQADSYVYVFQCDGSYRSRAIANGAPADIDVRGRVGGSFNPGDIHVMGLLMIDNAATWYFDGEELGSFTTGRSSDHGGMTFGAQLGAEFTVTSWQVWAIDETASGIDTTVNPADDPVNAREFTGVLFSPEFTPPTPFIYGLHYPVARYVNPNGMVLYNNDPTALMEFPEVEGSNYYVEMNFVVRNCYDDALLGLIWRATEDQSSFYAFGIQCDGNYRARAVVNGVAGEVIAEGTLNETIPLETVVSLGVYVKDDTVWLYYNRELLTSFTDTTLSSGRTGIILQSSSEGKKIDLIVTDVGVLGVD